jgi:hypothetical protein
VSSSGRDLSGTFATVVALPVSNGTDDTATLNALLAPATGKRVRGLPGQSYIISAPLVMPSRVELDMTDCTVTLKAGSNCNMVNNKAITAVATAADGAIASGSAVLTSATLAAVAVIGQTVIVNGADVGGYLLVGNVTGVGGGTVTLSKVAGTTIAAAGTVTLYNRDTNIVVNGGTWNRGANAGVATGLHSMRFRHVDELTVTNVTLSSTAGKYMINPGDCTLVAISDVTAAGVFSNIVQFNGPIYRFHISDVTGTSGDDCVALTPSDYPTYLDTSGDITDGVIESIRASSTAANVVRVLGGSPATACRRVTIRDVSGAGVQAGLWIGDDTSQASTTGGLIDDFLVQNVTATVPNGARMMYINGANMGRMTVDHFQFDNVNSTTDVLAVASTGVLDTLTVRNVNVINIGAGQPVVTVGGTVRALIVDGVTMKTTTGPGHIVSVPGTVTDCVVRAVTASAGAVAGYAVSAGAAASVITRLTLSDIHLAGLAGLFSAPVAGATVPNIEASNITLNGTAWLVDLNTSTELHLSSVTLKAPTQGIVNARVSAVLTMSGEGCNLAPGTQNVKVTAGGKVAVRVWDCPPSTTAGGFPTVAAGAGLGVTPTVVVAGTDRAGTLTLTPGSTPAAGVLATLTFIGTWAQAPKVSLTPTNAAAQAVGAYLSAKTTTTFVVSAANVPAAVMTFDYVIAA